MSTRVIVTFFLLIITIVLPSETIKLSKGTRAQVNFIQNVLQNVGEIFNKFVDHMLNVDDIYNLTSSDEIKRVVSDVDLHFNREIMLIERTIVTETASIIDECKSISKKLRHLVDDMKALVEYCEGKYESVALKYNYEILVRRNFLSRRIDDHKTIFNACIANCTNTEFCTRAIICMGWNAFITFADVRPAREARQKYSYMASNLKVFLNNFDYHVRLCLTEEDKYGSLKRNISQILADASKCSQVQSLQHPTSSTAAPVSSVDEDIS